MMTNDTGWVDDPPVPPATPEELALWRAIARPEEVALLAGHPDEVDLWRSIAGRLKVMGDPADRDTILSVVASEALQTGDPVSAYFEARRALWRAGVDDPAAWLDEHDVHCGFCGFPCCGAEVAHVEHGGRVPDDEALAAEDLVVYGRPDRRPATRNGPDTEAAARADRNALDPRLLDGPDQNVGERPSDEGFGGADTALITR